MIVDLMRNDLSRVCTDDSVTVRQLCQIERYEYVQHLVSVVEGQLRARARPWPICCEPAFREAASRVPTEDRGHAYDRRFGTESAWPLLWVDRLHQLRRRRRF